jgi:hypothetical protein
MRSNIARAAVALGVIVAAVVLFAVLSSDEGEDEGQPRQAVTTTKQEQGTAKERLPKPSTITIQNGKPVGGVKKLEYTQGEQVRFVVRSDVTDEIHVHGYDRLRDVRAGGSVRFDFPANLEGVFEVELEQRKEQIAELRVNPS